MTTRNAKLTQSDSRSTEGDVSHRSPKSKRFTDDQRQQALALIEAGVKREQVAQVIGATVKSLSRWVVDAKARGKMPDNKQRNQRKNTKQNKEKVPSSGQAEGSVEVSSKASSLYAPKDPGQGLSEQEVAAILELKKKHPSYGPAQLRAQLKRFKGWRLANKAIARVLRQAGYELVHRGSRPKGFEPVRFEAPRRNALWQADYTELRIGYEKLSLLVIVDDFSRYVVGHRLCDEADTKNAIEVLRLAIARHGKPEAVRTDRGGSFTSGEFKAALENELVDHIVGRPYHPQGGGKVEAIMGTVKRELWELEHFEDRGQAERRLISFFDDYNEKRAHMGIDGLTPADRFFGRADHVMARINAVSRQRNGALARNAGIGSPVEEVEAGPMEVIRLVIVDGQVELRMLGAVVRLGSL